MNGKKMPRNIKVMTTPLVMNLIGEKLLPIYISPSVMEKILKTKHSKEISPEILKKLPKALTDPLMILRAIDNKELILYFVIFCLVVVLVSAIRRRGAAHGWNLSIVAGGAAYVILLFVGGYFANNEVSILSQIAMVIASIVIAVIVQFLYNVIDYTREETFEFEDEEYYYYVRAIPKVSVEEEEFNVTQITVPAHRFSLKRKEHKEQDKEQEKGEEI